MEALHTLSEGDEGVRSIWPTEYFETFYDVIPHQEDGDLRENTAVTQVERKALLGVREILDNACDATPKKMNAEDFIATGWPLKIQPIARDALSLMMRRGRFSEEVEEFEPSSVGEWP